MADETAGGLVRCAWATNPLMLRYHDEEWGVPVHDDRALFEFLVLEGAQAGLSWDTILRRREGYRAAFAGFDAATVAAFGPEEIAKLLADPGIIRNRLKVAGAVQNARAFLAVQQEFGSFDGFVWQFVGGRPRVNAPRSLAELPAETAESRALSKELRRRGFTFVGPTICYAFMQATGMVNDHTVDCFRSRRLVISSGRRAVANCVRRRNKSPTP
jgi:DNA-3-methyladenine glycosylase I